MAEITLQGKTYTKIAKIGRGGQGIVWEAENGGSRPVVLKELYGIVASEQPDPEVSDVEKQVKILRQLQGVAGIPELIDAGFADDQRYYVAMNHILGKTLEEQVKEGKRYTKEEAREMLQQLLTTLGACHTRGLIHRDVKPDNIKMYEGQAIFVDVSSFGDALAKTQTIAIGTLGYVAPEQKALETKPASDIYGLGKTMYRILTREEVPALVELNTKDFDGIRTVYGNGLGNILEKMCQPELARRHKNVAEVLHDLEVGDVTEKFAIVKREEKKGEATLGIVGRVISKGWDWLRYDPIDDVYDEYGAPTGQNVLKKRFGAGPACLVVDSDGKPLYGTNTTEFKEAVITNLSGNAGIFYKLIPLNDKKYLVFRLANGKQALVSEDGEMFGKMFEDLGINPLTIKEGTITDYIKIQIRPENKTGLVSQFMGKDGLIGLQDPAISALELYNKDGWTKVTKDNKQALVSPDGKIFADKYFDKVSTPTVKDSTGTTYVLVSEQEWMQLINESGEIFGAKFPLVKRIVTKTIPNISFEDFNAKEYAHVTLKHEGDDPSPWDEHTYIAKDGSILGNKFHWRNVEVIEGVREQYAVCKTDTTVEIVDKDNQLVFGGAHQGFQWHSQEGGLEAVCFGTTVDDNTFYSGDTEQKIRKYERVVVKNKTGNILYLSAEEQQREKLYDHVTSIDATAVVIENQVIRKVDKSSTMYGFGSQGGQELRTQDGTILCAIQTPGRITSYGKTADNKLSVLYDNSRTEIIDVLNAVKDPTFKPHIITSERKQDFSSDRNI